MADFPQVTAGDLKRALQNIPDNTPLVYASDDEGNQFRYVTYLPGYVYVKQRGYYGPLEIGDASQVRQGYKKVLSIN